MTTFSTAQLQAATRRNFQSCIALFVLSCIWVWSSGWGIVDFILTYVLVVAALYHFILFTRVIEIVLTKQDRCLAVELRRDYRQSGLALVLVPVGLVAFLVMLAAL